MLQWFLLQIKNTYHMNIQNYNPLLNEIHQIEHANDLKRCLASRLAHALSYTDLETELNNGKDSINKMLSCISKIDTQHQTIFLETVILAARQDSIKLQIVCDELEQHIFLPISSKDLSRQSTSSMSDSTDSSVNNKDRFSSVNSAIFPKRLVHIPVHEERTAKIVVLDDFIDVD